MFLNSCECTVFQFVLQMTYLSYLLYIKVHLSQVHWLLLLIQYMNWQFTNLLFNNLLLINSHTHFFSQVYILCTQWWCWMCEFLCFPSFSWRCQAHEAAPLFHPVAACQSKPSAKAAEKRKMFYLSQIEILPYILSTSKLVQCHAQSSPWCRRLQTSLQCPKEERKNVAQKLNNTKWEHVSQSWNYYILYSPSYQQIFQ